MSKKNDYADELIYGAAIGVGILLGTEGAKLAKKGVLKAKNSAVCAKNKVKAKLGAKAKKNKDDK